MVLPHRAYDSLISILVRSNMGFVLLAAIRAIYQLAVLPQVATGRIHLNHFCYQLVIVRFWIFHSCHSFQVNSDNFQDAISQAHTNLFLHCVSVLYSSLCYQDFVSRTRNFSICSFYCCKLWLRLSKLRKLKLFSGHELRLGQSTLAAQIWFGPGVRRTWRVVLGRSLSSERDGTR